MQAKTLQRPLGPRPSARPGGARAPAPTLRIPNHLSPSPTPPPPPEPVSSASLLTPPKPKPKLGLAMPKDTKFAVYTGGPSDPAETYLSPASGEGERTIRPPLQIPAGTSSNATTIIPANAERKEPTARIQDAIRDITDGIPRQLRVADDTESIAISSDWSDDFLEELSCLGEGAGGAVHKVKDKRNGTVLARKTITTREAPMKQLLRELSIMSSTKHANIVAFYGVYMSPSSSEVKILMECCEGGSLESVAKKIRERGAIVGEKIAGRLAEGILQGLAYLHSRKTIHRDIKPSNILLSREGLVKLTDFGVSGELDVFSLAQTFTGTSFYMAPERICGKDYTIRSDVWSTGITLLELVQNRFPFPPDLPPIELMMYITNQDPPRLEDAEGAKPWSEEMKDFIKQTLTVDPNERPTPSEMLNHPWIQNTMKVEYNMGKWIAQVWGWAKKKSRDESTSRPSTASGSP